MTKVTFMKDCINKYKMNNNSQCINTYCDALSEAIHELENYKCDTEEERDR